MYKNIPQIQFITQDHPKLSHSEQAKLAFENGIEAVQIRMKNSIYIDFLKEASQAMEYAKSMKKLLIINDSIEIAKEVGAQAIHLGLKDTPIDLARTLLGDRIIIGGTANTYEDIILQIKRGANYIGLGPFRYTDTKKNLSSILGWNRYSEIINQLKKDEFEIPIVAVGGIQLDEIDMFHNLGIHGVALSSSLLQTLIQIK